jgi:hypothetical protein
MHHLRLVGVHEDGMHLLLADDEGSRFAVPLDEALRAAARRDVPRLGQLQIEIADRLRPKDVQSMIRAGLTAEEVAERANWPVEKVHRYEGPILAEREHVATLARQVRLRPRGGSHGGAPTLDARVTERLRSREIDGASARWDSRRTEKGAWTVLLVFNAGGRQREAAWHFDPLTRTVSAVDDEARWLSEDEDQQAPGPIPAPHLNASNRPSRVYDVEAEGGVAAPSRRREGETVDLMAAMRERSAQRGRRRRPKSTEVPGLDSAPEEALPLEELARDLRDELPPPAHTHPEDDPEVVKSGTTEQRVGTEAARRRARRAEPTQPVHQVPDETPSPATVDARTDATDDRTTGDGMPPDGTTHGTTQSATDGTDDATPAREEHSSRPRSLTRVASAPASSEEAGSVRDSDQLDVDGAAPGVDYDALADDYDDVLEQRAAAPDPKPAPKPGPPARKSGRPSVPSWDDIMFGRKND